MKAMKSLAIRFDGKDLFILDQTALPDRETWQRCQDTGDIVDCIKTLKVRGAPLIGVAAALYLGKVPTDELRPAAEALRKSRPTAVNLMHAIDRILAAPKDAAKIAEAIFDEDVKLCDAISENGAALIEEGDHVLTHCNTGSLATAGSGTALGIIKKAHAQGKKIHVWVSETRPLLQGARLTAWELRKEKIPHTLITDSMPAFLMQQGKVSKIFVGADRIATNGDFANKIGTYSLAVAANFHKVPFYVAAPVTTVDKNCPSGRDIPIEYRKSDEVLKMKTETGDEAEETTTSVYNPAFDVTPAKLVTAFVLNSKTITDFSELKN